MIDFGPDTQKDLIMLLNDIVFSYRVRGMMPIFNRRKDRAVTDWFLEKDKETRNIHNGGKDGDGMYVTDDSVFIFSCNDVVGNELEIPLSSSQQGETETYVMGSPYAFSRFVKESGIVFQEICSMKYCFVGYKKFAQLVLLNIESDSMLPIIGQMSDYNHSKSGFAFQHVSHSLLFGNFMYWFERNADQPDCGRNIDCTSINPIHDDYLWLSHNYISIHTSLLLWVLIDYFFYNDQHWNIPGHNVIKQVYTKFPNSSPEDLYQYVKFILEFFTHDVKNRRDTIPLVLDDISFIQTASTDSFAHYVSGQPYVRQLDYPKSLIPISPSLSYFDGLKELEGKHNYYTKTAIQIAELLKWLIKLIYAKHYLPYEYDNYFIRDTPNFSKISERLRNTVHLEIRSDMLSYLYNSARLIFSMPRGVFNCMFRLFSNGRIYVNQRFISNGSGDIAIAKAMSIVDSRTGYNVSAIIETMQYYSLDRTMLSIDLPNCFGQQNSIPIPKSTTKLVVNSIAVRYSDPNYGNPLDLKEVYFMRLFNNFPEKQLESIPGGYLFDKSRQVFICNVMSHLSMMDIGITLGLYTSRFPFADPNELTISYERHESCILTFPPGVKNVIQMVVPVWMHYTQTAPQNVIMAPFLFVNFMRASMKNDYASMLCVAESIYALCGGVENRITIVPKPADIIHGDWKKKNRRVQFDRDIAAAILADNFVIHMSALPVFIGVMQSHVLAIVPYRNIDSFSSDDLSDLKVIASNMRDSDSCIPPNAKLKTEITQFNPLYPNIYSAIRAYINVACSHVITYNSALNIIAKFSSIQGRHIKYPYLCLFIDYLGSIIQNKANMIDIWGGVHGVYVYLSPSFNLDAVHHRERFLDDPLFANIRNTWLISSYYSILYVLYLSQPVTAEDISDLTDLFLTVHLYSEIAVMIKKENTSTHSTEKNYIPPTYAYRIDKVDGSILKEVFEKEVSEKDASCNEVPLIEETKNRLSSYHKSFYNFIFNVECLAHFRCIGVKPRRAIRDLMEGGVSGASTSAEPFDNGERTSDVTYSSFRGMATQWNFIPQLGNMIKFESFIHYPPDHDIWYNVMMKYFTEHVLDLVYFNRSSPGEIAQSIANKFVVNSDEVFDSVTPPDKSMEKAIKREVFPTLSISNLRRDSTNVRNQESPFYGMHTFLPFMVTFCPLTGASLREFVFTEPDKRRR